MMIWVGLASEQWSAIGTVVSAIVAILNLIVVVILVRYNKKATKSMEQQARDTQAQTTMPSGLFLN